MADNDIEMECKDRSQNQIFHNLIEQTCYLTLIDDILDIDFTSTTPVKVLSVNDDFIKVEYRKGKKIIMKLVDMDLIIAIKVVEGVEV